MTKSEFSDWKRHPVTQQVFSQLEARVSQLTAELIEQAAHADPRSLAEKSAAIRAYSDLLNIEYEESYGD